MHPKQKEIELLQTGFCWEWVDLNFMLHRRRRRQFFKNEDRHQFRKDSFNLYSFELGTKSSMYKKYNMLPKKMKIRTLSQGKPPQGRVSDRVTKQSRPTPKPTPRSSPPNHFQRNIGHKQCDITCCAKQIIPFHCWTEKKNVEDEDGGETRLAKGKLQKIGTSRYQITRGLIYRRLELSSTFGRNDLLSPTGALFAKLCIISFPHYISHLFP